MSADIIWLDSRRGSINDLKRQIRSPKYGEDGYWGAAVIPFLCGLALGAILVSRLKKL